MKPVQQNSNQMQLKHVTLKNQFLIAFVTLFCWHTTFEVFSHINIDLIEICIPSPIWMFHLWIQLFPGFKLDMVRIFRLDPDHRVENFVYYWFSTVDA